MATTQILASEIAQAAQKTLDSNRYPMDTAAHKHSIVQKLLQLALADLNGIITINADEFDTIAKQFDYHKQSNTV